MTTVVRRTDASLSLVEHRRDILQSLGWQVRASVWSPPTDVFETDDARIVRVEVAGMRESDFEIAFEDDFLIITGNRPDTQERRAYHQMEIRFGKFSITVGLPSPVDVDASRAEYSDGFLTIVIPKIKPNRISIQE
jgi:HSP20 family protein